MTDAGWAEKLVGYAGKIDWAAKAAFTHVTDESLGLSPNAANARIAQLLRAEHRRAVRVVKCQLDLYQRQREVEKDEHMRDLLAGSIFACVDLLESLQRGRE